MDIVHEDTPTLGLWDRRSYNEGMRQLTSVALVLLLAIPASAQEDWPIVASSYLGGGGEDAVHGARVQSDGTLVLAVVSTGDPPGGDTPALGDAAADAPGMIVRLAPDGRSVRSAVRVADAVYDLDLDDDDRIHVAAGEAGYLRLDAAATAIEQSLAPGHVHRVDAAGDGRAVVLVPDDLGDPDNTPGNGTVHLIVADGSSTVSFSGHRNTLDVALHAASDTIVLVGWRQARADGNPVQIAYLRGVGTDGATRWTGYDWGTDNGADDFINRPENNMADTRGYRVEVGRDGRVYAGFEAAGGNHIFRYDPFDVTARVEIVGGDRYHEFFDSRAEHKTFFARYDPATGAYLSGQQLCGRLSSGRCNTVRMRRGAITADELGRVYLAGSAAAGLPLTVTPAGTGEYTGGGYVIAMSEDLTERLFVTRIDPGGESRGLDARVSPRTRCPTSSGRGARARRAPRRTPSRRSRGRSADRSTGSSRCSTVCRPTGPRRPRSTRARRRRGATGAPRWAAPTAGRTGTSRTASRTDAAAEPAARAGRRGRCWRWRGCSRWCVSGPEGHAGGARTPASDGATPRPWTPPRSRLSAPSSSPRRSAWARGSSRSTAIGSCCGCRSASGTCAPAARCRGRR